MKQDCLSTASAVDHRILFFMKKTNKKCLSTASAVDHRIFNHLKP